MPRVFCGLYDACPGLTRDGRFHRLGVGKIEGFFYSRTATHRVGFDTIVDQDRLGCNRAAENVNLGKAAQPTFAPRPRAAKIRARAPPEGQEVSYRGLPFAIPALGIP